MSVTTALGRSYSSQEESIVLRAPIVNSQKSTLEKIKDFVIQPWFLGVLGGVLFLLILVLLLCCVCRRSSNKKDVDNVPIELQNTEAVRKAPRYVCCTFCLELYCVDNCIVLYWTALS
jgi:hypothetical protein